MYLIPNSGQALMCEGNVLRLPEVVDSTLLSTEIIGVSFPNII